MASHHVFVQLYYSIQSYLCNDVNLYKFDRTQIGKLLERFLIRLFTDVAITYSADKFKIISTV